MWQGKTSNKKPIDLDKKHASSDERLLNLSQLVRGQVHVGNGAGNQLTSDPEPLLSRRWPGPRIFLADDVQQRRVGTDAIKDIRHYQPSPEILITNLPTIQACRGGTVLSPQ